MPTMPHQQPPRRGRQTGEERSHVVCLSSFYNSSVPAHAKIIMRLAPYDDRVTLFLIVAASSIIIGGGSSSGSSNPRFSSSIVTHNANDVSLGLDSSLIQHHSSNNLDEGARSGDYSGIMGQLHRSDIDRDPFIYQRSHVDDEDDNDEDKLPSYNNVPNHHHHHQSSASSSGGYQWQSPLEGYSPLPSLSLRSRSQQQSSSLSTEANLSINPSFQRSHSHVIDMHAPSSSTLQQHHPKLRTRTTGTTIVALLAGENSTVLILAADARATDGSIVSDKQCSKLHQLASNVWAAGAGTSADVEALVRRTKYKFWRMGRTYINGCGGIGNIMFVNDDNNILPIVERKMDKNVMQRDDDDMWRIVSPSTDGIYDDDTNRNDGSKLIPPPASVTAVLHYLRTQLRKARGNLGVNLLAGGYDPLTSRAILAAVHPHGSIDIVSYSALGSGGLAAMGVLESRYPRIRRRRRKQESTAKADMSSSSSSSCMMTVAEGIQLAVDAVRAGIDNDLGSGSQVDVCVIGPGGVFYQRAVAKEEELQWMSNNDVNDDVDVDGDDITGASTSVGGAVLESSWKTSREEGQGGSSGVNGFGNIPFAIQSKKVVIGNRSSSSFDVDNNVEYYKQGRSWLDEVMLAKKSNEREY